MIKYTSTVIALALAFTNFVACGAKMYQITVKDDHSGSRESLYANIFENKIDGIQVPNGWGNQIPISYSLSYELSGDAKQAIETAMAKWEHAVGRKLFVDNGSSDSRTGDDFDDLYSSLSDRINGYYRDDHWEKTGKEKQVIATTIWNTVMDNENSPGLFYINTADIRFNYQYYNLGDSYKTIAADHRQVVDIESIALHELGHLLGLAHIDSNLDPHSVMKPSFLVGENLSSRKLSKGDIERIQIIYGCVGYACDVDKTFLAMERNQPLPSIDR